MKAETAFKALADKNRLRLLGVLSKKELCVCQLMAVLGISQPLVSRNLSILRSAGFVSESRKGKLVFYKVKSGLPAGLGQILKAALSMLSGDETVDRDFRALGDCMEYQKKSGKCDMKTFLSYMQNRGRK